MTAATVPDQLAGNVDAGAQDEAGDGGEDRIKRAVSEIILRYRRNIHNRRWAVDRNTFLNEAFDKDAQYVEFDPAPVRVLFPQALQTNSTLEICTGISIESRPPWGFFWLRRTCL